MRNTRCDRESILVLIIDPRIRKAPPIIVNINNWIVLQHHLLIYEPTLCFRVDGDYCPLLRVSFFQTA